MATLELGGEQRELRLDLNAMCRFEELTGKNVWTGMQEPTAADTRALVWACLNDPDLTLEDVGSMITLANMDEIAKAIIEENPTPAQSG